MKIAATALLSLALLSCKTNLLTLRVVEPPLVIIDPNVKGVGIINRSLPNDESRGIDKMDQILSVEGLKLDKEGAEKAISGIYHELMAINRFDAVLDLQEVTLRGTTAGVFPAPINWETVDQICSDNRVDVVFVLEVYDTDTKVEYTSYPVKIKGPLGIEVPAVEHQASMMTLIKTGWRIYDPAVNLILDEIAITESIESTGRGINPTVALAAIIGRKEAVMQASSSIGQNYVSRILPVKIRVAHDYYVKGTQNFKIARRRAQTGNWDGAGELWEQETSNPKGKVAGRAHYNMAIINEINGNLDTAIEWAQKSYEDYNDRLALKYLRILKNRRVKKEILDSTQN